MHLLKLKFISLIMSTYIPARSTYVKESKLGGVDKMPLEERFIKRNGELQQKVKEEIEKVKEGQSERNIVQLQTILTELQTSSRQKNIILSYPQIIIDSWDYSDYLGMELVELAELYKKI